MGRQITVWINNFNRLTTTRNLVAYLANIPDCRAAILDNASTFPPLIEWYEQSPCEVVRLDQNQGHLAPWITGVVGRDEGAGFYAVTDPDLDLSSCPIDLFDVLRLGFERYPERIKVGLALALEDLPCCFPWRQDVIDHESQFWSHPLDDQFFDAAVDTSFALYRSDLDYLREGWRYTPSLRTNVPYVVRHTPWYLDPLALSPEEGYYFARATAASSNAERIRRGAGLDAGF